jgi:hypothetical protein
MNHEPPCVNLSNIRGLFGTDVDRRRRPFRRAMKLQVLPQLHLQQQQQR